MFTFLIFFNNNKKYTFRLLMVKILKIQYHPNNELGHAIMGIDTQLVKDGTYFIVECDGALAGCGGWSFRATLYGGDHSTDLRDPARLDPATEPARVRAMYLTYPTAEL